jgi:hypothetical protein
MRPRTGTPTATAPTDVRRILAQMTESANERVARSRDDTVAAGRFRWRTGQLEALDVHGLIFLVVPHHEHDLGQRAEAGREFGHCEHTNLADGEGVRHVRAGREPVDVADARTVSLGSGGSSAAWGVSRGRLLGRRRARGGDQQRQHQQREPHAHE